MIAEAFVEGLLVGVEDLVHAQLVDGSGGKSHRRQPENAEKESQAEARPIRSTGTGHRQSSSMSRRAQ
jgi:hypothetical protein